MAQKPIVSGIESDGVEVVEVIIVSQAVDDGDLYARTRIPEKPVNNVHKLSDAILRTRERVTHKIHDITDSVKASASQMSHDVKVKASDVSDSVKKSVDTVHTKVQANPYLYAAGAVGVGFVLGRIFLSYRDQKNKQPMPDFRNYRSDLGDHTGVHIRPERSYASGSGI